MRPGHLSIQPYWGVDNTLYNIKKLIRETKDSPEVAQFDNADLLTIFNVVKNLPYIPDPENFEWLQAPRWTLIRGGDCDDKSTLLGAIFERRGIPYRMVVVSTEPSKEFHHIYLEVLTTQGWLPYDATYNYNKIFEEEPYTVKRVYEWFGTDRTKTFEIHPEYKSLTRQRSLAGSGGQLGESVKLAILRGNKNGMGCANCDCTKCTKSCSRRRAPFMGSLGFDPGTVVTAATVVYGLFNSLFGAERYQDAYNAWAQAETSLNQAAAQGDFQLAAANRAIIAVLSRDYMNPPMGADVCTSSGRCGNRAEWAVIQPAVMEKAQGVAPFFYWIDMQMKAGKLAPNFSLEQMVIWYDEFKNGGPLYTQFLQQMQSGTGTGTANAGQFAKLLPFVAAGAALYFLT